MAICQRATSARRFATATGAATCYHIHACPAPLPAAARTVEETNDACLIVRHANGLALAYVYFEGESGRRAAAHSNDHHDARDS